MSAAIEALRAQIKNKKNALARLKEQEAELKKLQAAVAGLPKLQHDIAALERSVAILRGEEAPEPASQTELGSIIDDIRRSIRENSIPAQVLAVLRNAGKPMSGDQIMGALASHGTAAPKQSVLGAIYRAAKQGKLFRLTAPGVFGLLEWPEGK